MNSFLDILNSERPRAGLQQSNNSVEIPDKTDIGGTYILILKIAKVVRRESRRQDDESEEDREPTQTNRHRFECLAKF